jgi:pimeloyl-ACP methyl ester carboxylesterase
MQVTAPDGTHIAVHDLGGDGPTLLVSHATGFHGRCYLPLAHALAGRFHSVALDYRGHGDTARIHGQHIDWNHYGDDAEAVARSLPTPVAAFGHSMGGAALLIAAHRDPSLFSSLVLFEPIVFPPEGIRPGTDGPSPMVEAARRRRASFPSYQAAIDNYASKPPLNAFTPEALQAYVHFGFSEDEIGHVHLKCTPHTEARTFEMSGSHRAWDYLPEIEVPVLVVAGVVTPMQPASIAAAVADRLPNGRYLQVDTLDHFGPMTHPDVVGEIVAKALADGR